MMICGLLMVMLVGLMMLIFGFMGITLSIAAPILAVAVIVWLTLWLVDWFKRRGGL